MIFGALSRNSFAMWRRATLSYDLAASVALELSRPVKAPSGGGIREQQGVVRAHQGRVSSCLDTMLDTWERDWGKGFFDMAA